MVAVRDTAERMMGTRMMEKQTTGEQSACAPLAFAPRSADHPVRSLADVALTGRRGPFALAAVVWFSLALAGCGDDLVVEPATAEDAEGSADTSLQLGDAVDGSDALPGSDLVGVDASEAGGSDGVATDGSSDTAVEDGADATDADAETSVAELPPPSDADVQNPEDIAPDATPDTANDGAGDTAGDGAGDTGDDGAGDTADDGAGDTGDDGAADTAGDAAPDSAPGVDPFLCDPCTTSATCGGGLCVAHGSDGAFCATVASSCPAGYSSQLATDVTGTSANVCVPTPDAAGVLGACNCSATAMAQGLSTTCSQINANGTCSGTRACSSSGLGACSAATPAAETCNGSDDNCNGATDESATCADDGNACTSDLCASGACAHLPADGTPCTLATAFCVAAECQAGVCAAISAGCDDGNPCTADACDNTTGTCSHSPASGPCSDNSACTDADACQNGACAGTAVVCSDGDPCTVDSCDAAGGCAYKAQADGAACEDGNFCSFGETCLGGACQGGTTVVCNSAGPCAPSLCDAKSGGCLAAVALPDGATCDDANACTTGDTCNSGVCGGALFGCDDTNPCTDDACSPASGCTHTANSGGCSDGNACTGPDLCGGSACSGGPALNCDDSDPCTSDACDPVSGLCVHTPELGTCSDGNVCTQSDTCVAGVCTGIPDKCDDSNACTDDSCVVGLGCAHTSTVAIAVACDDNDPCTTGDVCSGGGCSGGAALTCDDNNPCTTDSCVAASGCVFAANTLGCDDGNACTTGDACQNGACKSGTNSCACNVKADCAASEDGNACNGTLICSGNKCVVDPATIVVCASTGKACQLDTCIAATGACGLQPAADGSACNDGSDCTQGETCATGVCQGGVGTVCTDNNPCTTDSCAASGGCTYTNNTLACDDFTACTTNDTCQGGYCVGTAAACDDGNTCTNDSCDAAGGCTHAFNTNACEDGNSCTIGDLCASGICVAGAGKTCTDGNICTNDGCDSTGGCVFANNTAACDDGSACTTGDVCTAGKCQGGSLVKVCNDNQPCTADSCDPVTAACVFKPITGCGGNCLVNADCPPAQGGCITAVCNQTTLKCVTQPANTGAPCNDGNLCTTGETCSAAGNCNGGQPNVCTDGNPCTNDACDVLNGQCVFAKRNNGGCNDNNPCTATSFCQTGVCTGGQTVNCNDNNPCTADACDTATGQCTHAAIAGCQTTCTATADCPVSTDPCLTNFCNQATGQCASQNANNQTACSDGNACTQVDLCFGGVCQGTQNKNCSDNNTCTDDACDKATAACSHAANANLCSDNNQCTTGDQCANSACVPGAVKSCNDNNPCTSDVCAPQNGNCFFQPIVGCGGFCQKDSDCPAPQNACTLAVCDITTAQCTSQQLANGTACTDNNPCTTTSACTAGTCLGTATLNCNDNNPCTVDFCNNQSGICQHNNGGGGGGGGCSDGNACTLNDQCQNGTCVGGNNKSCNDNNACTADSCDKATGGCINTAITGCGQVCATNADCPTSTTACKVFACSQQTLQCALVNVQNGSVCDDGSLCTQTDGCAGGVCVGGNNKNCGDNNTCTTDTCDPATGICAHAPASGNQCTDGNPCTNNTTCVAGVCLGNVPNCNDNNPCTADSCVSGGGGGGGNTQCLHTVIAGCAAACTVDTDCAASGLACVVAYCNAGSCGLKNAAAQTSCSDNNACTNGDYCQSGTCIGGATINCNDNNGCTQDGCSATTGLCTHTPTDIGDGCNDGNLCTLNDQCSNQGTCVGTPRNCNDQNACTADSCNVANGQCVHTAISNCP